MKIQKIKLILIVIISSILTLICLFAPILNPSLHNFLLKLNVICGRDSLIVHYVSVGQGDAIVINLPDGKSMIIDAGTSDRSATFTNYIDDYVLARDRDKVIDYVVFTHSDNDHVGGGLRLLQNYDIGELFLPNIYSDSDDYIEILQYLDTVNLSQKRHMNGYTISNSGYVIQFLGPMSGDSTNNNCPIVKLSYNGFSFLFTGDISSNTESLFVDMFDKELDCDVLKVAHHGSKYSTSFEFLLATTPTYSVISCGENSYGHPTDIVINNLSAIGSEVLRTDVNGNIAFVVNEYGINHLCGNYIISNVVDYRIYIMIVEGVIMGTFVIGVVKSYIVKRKSKMQ